MAERPRVLIVDDQPTIASMLAEMVGRCGAEIADVVHGREAAAALLAEPRRHDVAFIDLKLGESLGGVELAHEAVRLGIKVIAITGYNRLPPELEGVALLMKPFSFQTVRLIFETVMKG